MCNIDLLHCPPAESLDYFQQGDSSADEGGVATEEAMPGSASAMDTSSPSTVTNHIQHASSNPENLPVEPSASSQAAVQRQDFQAQDLEPDRAVTMGGVLAPGTVSAVPPTLAASSASTLDVNPDTGEKINKPCSQFLALCAFFSISVFLVQVFIRKKCFVCFIVINVLAQYGKVSKHTADKIMSCICMRPHNVRQCD